MTQNHCQGSRDLEAIGLVWSAGATYIVTVTSEEITAISARVPAARI